MPVCQHAPCVGNSRGVPLRRGTCEAFKFDQGAVIILTGSGAFDIQPAVRIIGKEYPDIIQRAVVLDGGDCIFQSAGPAVGAVGKRVPIGICENKCVISLVIRDRIGGCESGIRIVLIDEGVVACTTRQRISAAAADQGIIAAGAVQRIIAFDTVQPVVFSITGQGIVTAAAS